MDSVKIKSRKVTTIKIENDADTTGGAGGWS
jgi:hypothetical protein